MKKPRPLKSVDAVIRAFGGKQSLADWIGVVVTAVYNWAKDEYFPPGYHYRLHVEAERRGYHIDASVFDGRRDDSKHKRRAA